MRENQNQETEIDLLELAIECLRHWKRILLSTIIIAVIAFVASVTLITPMYASTAKLYVLSSSSAITSLADLQMGTNLTKDYVEVIKSRPVLDQTIINLGLEDDDYISLGERVTVNNPADSRIMEIKVTDADPKAAKDIADEIAEVSRALISDKMNQDAPSVLQYGYVPVNPDSPDITKNTAVGAAVGFILAIITVVVGFLMNDTIMSPEDLEKKLELNLLASIPMDREEYDGEKRKHHKKHKDTKKSGKNNKRARKSA